MPLSSKEAAALLQELITASHACLDLLKISHLPPPFRKNGKTVERTRPWRTPGGPEGIAFHYTGGLDGIKSLRWFNDPAWKNEASSAHVLIFDRLVPELAEVWLAQPISRMFRVPTLIIADLTLATWSTNWANGRCLGVENRNSGFSVYDENKLGKARIRFGPKLWEPYTREQLEANIQLGRLTRLVRGGAFKREWVVGHSQIWATKSDPGPAFPLRQVRAAIWSDEPVEQLSWLGHYPQAVFGELGGVDEAVGGGFAGDPEPSQPSWDAERRASLLGESLLGEPHTPHLRGWLLEALERLGWPVGPMTPTAQLRDFVAYYQRSTLAHLETHPEKVLSVDGVAGPLTRASIRARLEELGV